MRWPPRDRRQRPDGWRIINLMPTIEAELLNRHWYDAIGMFSDHYTRGEMFTLAGVRVATSGVTMPLLNMAVLEKPVADEQELQERIRFVASYFGERNLMGMFALCDDFIPVELRGRTAEYFQPYRLDPYVPMTGMIAEELAAPVHALPALEIRSTQDREVRSALGEINCIAYDAPVTWGHEVISPDTLWNEENEGYVGYQDGKPVAAALATLLPNTIYLSWVATMPEHQRKGYAEAVVRHALADGKRKFGIQRTSLHATPAGRPLYEQLGYRAVTSFSTYVVSHQTAYAA
jgi:GNAT superfamily N-acetyltransferase